MAHPRSPLRRHLLAAVVMALVAGACTNPGTARQAPTSTTASDPVGVTGADAPPGDTPPGDTPATTASPPGQEIEDYPDAMTRRLWRMANEPRPVEDSAMPPRHLDVEQFPTSLVERTRIVSGGVLPDGIPSLDDPAFEPAADVGWLAPDEAVLVLEVQNEARAYPIRIMLWHEIVNHTLAGIPVTVSYCPLCNSALAYDRRTESGTLDFGTSGALYLSALVMYDRQTESLWTHFDGRAVIGTLVGTQLTRLPVATVPWEEFRRAHPDGEVLSTETGHRRDYGRNPYVAYEDIDKPLSGFFTGDLDQRLAPMTRVVGLDLDDDSVAVLTEDLRQEGVVDLQLATRPVTVWHASGMSSPLDEAAVDDGIDIGATGAFFTDGPDGPTTFERRGDLFIDTGTGSAFNLLGRAVDGPRAGHQLEPVVHLDTFWFAWSSYHEGSRLLASTR